MISVYQSGGLVVQQERQQRVILNNAEERLAFPTYSPTGHIIYQRGFPNSKGIWAVPFDGMQVTGDPFPVDPVGSYPTVSSNGTLVYRSVDEIISFPPGRLIWVDRQGRVESFGDSRAGLAFPALSPDGKRVAFTATYQRNQDIWIYDLQRDTPERLTFDSHPEYFPVWSPNGRWVAFQSYRTSNSDIYIRVSDGSGAGQMLVGGPGADRPSSLSIDGQYLIYTNSTDSTSDDLWYAMLREENGNLTLDGSQIFLGTQYTERGGQLSPDGRYLTYESNESGQFEVYVVSFPGGGGKRQVSSAGGMLPRWNPQGGELFYVEPQGNGESRSMMAVSIETQGVPKPGRPNKLFDLPQRVFTLFSTMTTDSYDISSDGQRFLLVQQEKGSEQPEIAITVVQNWYKELKDHK